MALGKDDERGMAAGMGQGQWEVHWSEEWEQTNGRVEIGRGPGLRNVTGSRDKNRFRRDFLDEEEEFEKEKKASRSGRI
jgi:hypothetical protein